MKIYLVGFMGAGKTTVGRELAARLDVPFFDLDELVEAAEKSSIKEIFAQHGEPYFRKRERDILRSTRHLERAVVATGGGTFTFDDNIQFIQAEGISVYLAAPYSLLRARVGDKAAERPLFRDDDAAHELYGYGAQPNQVLDTMRNWKARKLYIRGNHDRVVAGHEDGEQFNSAAKIAALWTRDHLSAPNRRFLQGLPLGPIEDGGLLICHGAPHNEDEYVFHDGHARQIFETT